MKPIYNRKQWEFIRELNTRGYSYEVLADWLYINPHTVYDNFKRHGLFDIKRPPLSVYTEKLNALGGDD